MNLWEKIKRALNTWLSGLARENKKQFGSSRLDCCNVKKEKTEGVNKS
ncbi:MAG: LDCC motif putative metal-binding protein [bacterium]|nr:LDCC motif putative metal-binding protein [bacterium]